MTPIITHWSNLFIIPIWHLVTNIRPCYSNVDQGIEGGKCASLDFVGFCLCLLAVLILPWEPLLAWNSVEKNNYLASSASEEDAISSNCRTLVSSPVEAFSIKDRHLEHGWKTWRERHTVWTVEKELVDEFLACSQEWFFQGSPFKLQQKKIH